MPGTAIALETAEGTPSVKVFGADRKGGVIFYMGAFGLRPELDASRWPHLCIRAMRTPIAFKQWSTATRAGDREFITALEETAQPRLGYSP